MIRYVKGNLLDAPEPLIIHGCNAQGVMGSGVAKAIREKWPVVFKAYRAWYKQEAFLHRSCCVGEVQIVLAEGLPQRKWVANLISQTHYGTDGRKYASYEAIMHGLTTIRDENWSHVAMPKIGCGLGGLQWTTVESLVEELLCDRGIDVAVYEL